MRWLACMLILLAGCASLTDGIVLFEVDGLAGGDDIFDAHVAAVDTDDVRYWAASVIVKDGRVKASTSTLVYNTDLLVSHGASLNGVMYTDQSDFYDASQLEIPKGQTITAPAGLATATLGKLMSLGPDGAKAITFFSQCHGSAHYMADGEGMYKTDVDCGPGDWVAVVAGDNNGQYDIEPVVVILR